MLAQSRGMERRHRGKSQYLACRRKGAEGGHLEDHHARQEQLHQTGPGAPSSNDPSKQHTVWKFLDDINFYVAAIDLLWRRTGRAPAMLDDADIIEHVIL